MTQNYSQFANPNATNSELDAKVVITPDHVTLDQNVNLSFLINDLSFAQTGNELIALIDNYLANQ